MVEGKIQVLGRAPQVGQHELGKHRRGEVHGKITLHAFAAPFRHRLLRRVDCIEPVGQAAAEDFARRLASEEGIFAGTSSGGALAVAMRVAARVENAVIVTIVCDRGDRYLSTGVFPA